MICIQAGQCGNQLGFCVLDSLYEHLEEHRDLLPYFFRLRQSGRSQTEPKWVARSVCIDTEPKVIHECIEHAKLSKKWTFDPNCSVYRHGGAGNNWAMGYQLCSGSFRESALDRIRHELEQVDISSTLVVMHSLGGGTGSGLGTRITEEISDEFSGSSIINLAVMPYHFGEVVVQHYNSVLSLAKIASSSNGVLLYENEVAHNLCVSMRGIEQPTLYDVNRSITSSVVPAFIPKRVSSPCCDGISGLLGQDMAHLCGHPGYRFMDVKNTPQTSMASVDYTYDSWSAILRAISRMDSSGSASERGLKQDIFESGQMRNIASTLTLHGEGAGDAARRIGSADIQFTSSYVSWAGGISPACTINYSPISANGYLRSASLISNGQSVIPTLRRPLLCGANMFKSGAYVHQYKSCGLEADEFVSAFRSLSQIVENYKNLN